LAAFLLSAPRDWKSVIVLPTVFGTWLNFVAIEFALLILIGFFTAKLHCYKLANSFLKFLPFTQ
jgi:hypothetical protein